METIKLMLGRVEKGGGGEKKIKGIIRGRKTVRQHGAGRVQAANNTMPHRKRRYNQVESEIRQRGTCGPRAAMVFLTWLVISVVYLR